MKGKNNNFNRNKNSQDHEAIELAILNGLEAYSREQEKKNTAERKHTGQLRTPAAMEEAGYHPQKKSRAKGKGTRIGTPSPARPAESKQREAPAPSPAPSPAPAKRTRQQPIKQPVKTSRPAAGTEKKPRRRPLKVLFFGGVGEIGKNMTALEYGSDIIVIDAGIIFPTEEMPGIDLVFPDISYLVKNRQKIKGLFLTHGHEDHIGGVPYFLKDLPDVPVYGTKLTLALVDNKLREHRLNNVKEITVSPKEKVKAGVFTVNFVNVNHSIAGALALAVETPYGIVFHSGDFKIDLTPVSGKPIDLEEIAEYGKRGVLLYLGESTNIERQGYTMSEKVVGTTLEHLFAENADRRIIIATFASNVHRLQQIIDIAVKFRRKVALSGRSMLSVVEAATKIGELMIPEGVLVDVERIKNYFDREIVIVSTGSQGEPMSALTRMADGEFNKVTIGKNDTIIISANPIPGNERMVYRVINNLYRRGAEVVYESLEKIHVSGHACQEEHKILHSLLKPKFFIPVHGEYRHLKRHALLAQEMGMDEGHIFIPEIGSTVEFTEDTMKQGDSFSGGSILIDGNGFEDLESGEALKDRLHMSAEGVFIIGVCLSDGSVIGEPVILSRGFVFTDEKTYLRELKSVVKKSLAGVPSSAGPAEAENAIRRAVRNHIFKRSKQSPMIVPVIQEI